jgi:hypothetical protein
MNCKTMLKSIIRCKNEIQPTAQARLRLEPTHRTYSTQALCGVAASFFCHGFCKPTHMQHIYFFERQKKNKRAASRHTEQKPTPKKTV